MLKELRKQQSLTQEELAERVGVSVGTLKRWESGTQKPYPAQRRHLCEVLGVSPDELRFQADEDEEEMKRRQFLSGLAATGGLLWLGQDPLEPPTLQDFEEINRQYGSWFWRLSPGAIQPLLREQQRRLLEAMTRAGSSKLRAPLGSLAAQTTVMYGLTSIRQADPTVSEERFLAAARLAQLAGDRDAEVMAMIAQRTLHIGPSPVEPRPHDGGYQILEEAARVISPIAPATLRTWLNCCLAEDAGALGREMAAMRHLEDAERSFTQISPEQLVGYYDHWDAIRLEGWRASTLLALGQPAKAAPILEVVAAQTPPELIGPRSAVVTDRGDAYGHAGEVELACSILGEAWDTAQRGGDKEMMTRTRRVQQRLAARTDSPALGQLAQLMAS